MVGAADAQLRDALERVGRYTRSLRVRDEWSVGSVRPLVYGLVVLQVAQGWWHQQVPSDF